MCGIAGFYSDQYISMNVEQVCKSIAHRGPDSSGSWVDDFGKLTLLHTRLSIIDLSASGQQPMHSECGRFTLIFNGEIYNHLKLRKRLEKENRAPKWHGHSDTETLLACITAWGVDITLKATVGMFSIALWDKLEKQLVLARDRMGEKPLYWGWCDDILLFGSELKSLKLHPAFNAEIDRNSLALLLRHSYIPAPYSIYKGINKLMPGHVIKIPLYISVELSKLVKSEPYWSVNYAVEQGQSELFEGSPEEAVDELDFQLAESVSDQMLADVSLGAFLSGGVDSSTVVALMQAQSKRPVRTFTIGFNESGYNEAVHAKAVSKHIGTDHTELYVSPADAFSVIPKLSSIYCEPFSDSSQIPTFLVSQMTKQHVTVALSGDGGDELFCGYNRYLAARKIWSSSQRLPSFARQIAAGTLRTLSPATWNKLFECSKPVLPKNLQLSMVGEKAWKLADVLTLPNERAFYRQLTSHWLDPESVVIGATEPMTLITNPSAWPKTESFEHSMMAMDAQTYMSDDILTKVDRAAMANSLETRVPILDHRVFELAWKMPLSLKIRDGQGKWLLRQVLYRYVPKELIERPKMGFGIPLDSWLRGPLRDWAESLLDEQRLIQEGYFTSGPVRKMWLEHLSGKHNWQHHLWNILMFQAWLEDNH